MSVVKVQIPRGKLGIKLKDGPEVGNIIRLYKILEGSVMEGKLFENDIILSMGGIQVSSIDELLPLVKKLEGSWRYVMVKRKPRLDEFEEKVQLDEEKGIEIVKAPDGPLGLRLDRRHKVLQILETSGLYEMVFQDDRFVSLNDIDVTKMTTKEFVALLSDQQNGKARVLGVKRAPNSPRQVQIPSVSTIGLVLKDNSAGYIDCLDLLDHSPLRGSIFAGDRITGANGRKVGSLKELMPLMVDKNYRVLTVVTPAYPKKKNPASQNNDNTVDLTSDKTSATSSGSSQLNLLKNKSDSLEETAMSTPYKTVGQENFVSVNAPPGKLGVKLGKNHEVMDILSTSPLAGKVFADDRVVSIDEVDVRGKDPSSLIVLLMASQHRTRVLGIRRKTGKQIRIAVQETRKRSIEDINRAEFEERFPNLCHYGVPMGIEAPDTSTRCKILSELLALHETIGLANDVETENGSFCHVIKIPKKGLNKKGELMSTLDDVVSGLDSICGTENNASDLLLEFLANRSPSSFLKYKNIAESRPTKRRNIEESKVDPDVVNDSPKRSSGDGVTDSTAIRIEDGTESEAAKSSQNETKSEAAKSSQSDTKSEAAKRSQNDTESEAAKSVQDDTNLDTSRSTQETSEKDDAQSKDVKVSEKDDAQSKDVKVSEKDDAQSKDVEMSEPP